MAYYIYKIYFRLKHRPSQYETNIIRIKCISYSIKMRIV